MFGCSSRADTFASRKKRLANVSSSETVSIRILTATGRSSVASIARHTSAIPPAPIFPSRR